MEEMLQEVIASGKFKAYTTPQESDAYFMVVSTPFKGDHEPDVSYVEAATRAVPPLLKEGDLYVIDSTSPIGTAEMCKLTENNSRDVQIAFVNELSLICDKVGINVRDLINLANKHPRVNILQSGCGVGVHCIAIDPCFITADYPKDSKIIAASRIV